MNITPTVNDPANTSKELEGNQKYFIEAMHQAVATRAVSVLWEYPGTERIVTITEQFLRAQCLENLQAMWTYQRQTAREFGYPKSCCTDTISSVNQMTDFSQMCVIC